MNELFYSKRFWLAVAAVITVVLKDRLPVSEDQVQQLVLVIASWIVGDSLRATDPVKRGQYGR